MVRTKGKMQPIRQKTMINDIKTWLLEEKDPAGLRFLLDRVEPDKATLTEACAIAREQGAAEALAILLEEQHKRFPSGMNKSFDL